MAVSLRRADPSPGGADLERAGVADEVHERSGATEVGHQPEARLAHGEPGVERGHAQVGREGQLEAGPDGVPVHLGDDERRDIPPAVKPSW